MSQVDVVAFDQSWCGFMIPIMRMSVQLKLMLFRNFSPAVVQYRFQEVGGTSATLT